MDIWKDCQGDKHVTELKAKAWRVVEAQHASTTRKLVDSLEEHALLEKLIDQHKPPVAQADYLHYLLFTPFRYPPLAYGSRFGRQYEPSLWYGSLLLSTAFAETAYYRFIFLAGTTAPIPFITVQLTAFQASIKTIQGINLGEEPFVKHHAKLSAPDNYQISQACGTAMRAAGIEAFIYQSARDQNQEKNIALFTTKAFASKQPLASSMQTWQCFTSPENVELTRQSSLGVEKHVFSKQQFLINDKLPSPAV